MQDILAEQMEDGLHFRYGKLTSLKHHKSSATLVRLCYGHVGRISGVDMNYNGTLIVSCSEDKTIRIWSSASGNELLTLPQDDIEASGHTKSISDVKFIPVVNQNYSSFIIKKTSLHEIENHYSMRNVIRKLTRKNTSHSSLDGIPEERPNENEHKNENQLSTSAIEEEKTSILQNSLLEELDEDYKEPEPTVEGRIVSCSNDISSFLIEFLFDL